MHEQAPLLKATPRDRLGTRYARRVRDRGLLPAVVYGHGRSPVAITVDAREALAQFRRGEKIFRLDMPESPGRGGDQMVLLKDVQFDHLGTNVVHADFSRVDLDERIVTRVPVRLVGDPVGLKTAGAVLIHPATEVQIECTVRELPSSIEISIAHLDVGQSVNAAALALPSASMKLVTDPHAILAQIVLQLEEKVAEEAAVEAAPGEPEVITAKKKEGDEAAPAADGKGKPDAKAAKPEAKAEAGKDAKKK